MKQGISFLVMRSDRSIWGPERQSSREADGDGEETGVRAAERGPLMKMDAAELIPDS